MSFRKMLLRLTSLALCLVIFITQTTVQATAISGEQRKAFQSGINWFDINAPTCSTAGSGGPVEITANIEEFIKAYGQMAFNTGKKYGIPYDAIIAQAALESGYGKSKLTQEAYNFFGIKAGSSWDGPVYQIATKEQDARGNETTISAAFRAYGSAQEGFDGYGNFILANSRYSKALQYPNDPVRYFEELKAAGYATDVAYVSKNVTILRAVQKYIADNKLFPPSSEVVPDAKPPVSDSSGSAALACSAGVGNGKLADVIRIAEAEYAKGPVEYDENVMKYTTGRQEAWCADFVSWVFKEAGIPFTGGSAGGWQIPAVLSLQSWFQDNPERASYFAVGSEAPQPGDVAFFIGAQTPDGGSTRHTSIVISVSGDKMVTIGGNEGDKVTKATRTIALDAQSLVGFGRVKQ